MTGITAKNDFRALRAVAGSSVDHEHEDIKHRAPGRRATRAAIRTHLSNRRECRHRLQELIEVKQG